MSIPRLDSAEVLLQGVRSVAKKQRTTEQEEKIRGRAYELWEQEGRPHSRHQEHWSKAEQELELTALNSNESEANAALAFDRNQTGPAVRDALDGREGSDFHKAETAKVRSRGEPPQVGSKAPRRQTKKVARGRQA
jgi:hypothetical protein